MSGAGQHTAPPPAAQHTAALPVRDAYRLWAPVYDAENAVTALEDAAVLRASPPVRGQRLLDAGCGTGRRLDGIATAARCALGVDLVPEMLAAGGRAVLLAAADVRALPMRAACFDILWCRLALGHLADPAPAYDELARVAARGAALLVTDFHPAAARAGHTRSFRDAAGVLHAVEHHVHDVAGHRSAAARAGWRLRRVEGVRVTDAVRPFYERAGALDRFRTQLGLPLVLFLAFARS